MSELIAGFTATSVRSPVNLTLYRGGA